MDTVPTKTLLLTAFLAIPLSRAEAQAPAQPANVYVYCYGPVPTATVRPAKVYFSAVSVVPMPLTATVEPAFTAFVKEKYGADVDPRCDFGSDEKNSRDTLKYWINNLKDAAVETGWLWTAPPAEPPKPANPARSGVR